MNPTPKTDDLHHQRASRLIGAVHDAISPVAQAYVYVTEDGDVFWGGSYGHSDGARLALLNYLTVLRKNIKEHQVREEAKR